MSDNALTITQLNNYLKQKFADDNNLKNVIIKGQVSNFTDHVRTGNYYFTLKDENSSIKAIMNKYKKQSVKFTVEEGMNLIVTGAVSVFTRDGVYQIYCDTLEPDGVGALFLAFEQLKAKLGEMNYFNPELKKKLPALPQNIGVVTAPTAAALQDILNILNRRYPLGTVTVFPTLVQGPNAAKSIVKSIQNAENDGEIDVLIVGRGGGSTEDLWSFNEEIVATAIFQCKIPVISAVGHEVDYTISDMVADVRAPTPSAAAEIVAPDIRNIIATVEYQRKKLEEIIQMRVYTSYQRILTVYNRLKANSPENKLEIATADLENKVQQLENIIAKIVDKKEHQMVSAVSTLEALSPLKVLTRGYSITYDDSGNIITDKEQVASGDKIITKLATTEITSIVE